MRVTITEAITQHKSETGRNISRTRMSKYFHECKSCITDTSSGNGPKRLVVDYGELCRRIEANPPKRHRKTTKIVRFTVYEKKRTAQNKAKRQREAAEHATRGDTVTDGTLCATPAKTPYSERFDWSKSVRGRVHTL